MGVADTDVSSHLSSARASLHFIPRTHKFILFLKESLNFKARKDFEDYPDGSCRGICGPGSLSTLKRTMVCS